MYLYHLVLLGEQGAMCVREPLYTGEIAEDKLLVVGGEVDGGHAVDSETYLFLEQIVGFVHKSLDQHSQEGMQHVLSERNLQEGR